MAETVQQYIERILSNVDGEPLTIQAATKQTLDHLIDNVAVDKLKRRLSPERWSIAEIVAHLVDAEIVAAFRIRKIVSEPGCSIPAYDQNSWASNLNYEGREPVQSIKDFGVLRDMNLGVLSTLTDEEWDRYGVHEERGKETLRQLVRLYAGHDINHLRQIESILRAL
jgi:hypothetical protein